MEKTFFHFFQPIHFSMLLGPAHKSQIFFKEQSTWYALVKRYLVISEDFRGLFNSHLQLDLRSSLESEVCQKLHWTNRGVNLPACLAEANQQTIHYFTHERWTPYWTPYKLNQTQMWTCFTRTCSTSWYQYISWYQHPFVLDSTSPWVWLLRCFSLRQQWIQGPLQAQFGNMAWRSNLSYKTVISKGARKEMVIPQFLYTRCYKLVLLVLGSSWMHHDFSLTPSWMSVNTDSLDPKCKSSFNKYSLVVQFFHVYSTKKSDRKRSLDSPQLFCCSWYIN